MLCDKLAIALFVVIFIVSWIQAMPEFGEFDLQADKDTWQSDYRFSKEHIGDPLKLDPVPNDNSTGKVYYIDDKPANNSSAQPWDKVTTISIICTGIASLVIL